MTYLNAFIAFKESSIRKWVLTTINNCFKPVGIQILHYDKKYVVKIPQAYYSDQRKWYIIYYFFIRNI